MLNYRLGAMTVLSLVIAAPVLVFGDVGNSRQINDFYSGIDDQQLVTVDTSTQNKADVVGADLGQHWRTPRLNGLDFPVRGRQQFATTDR
jgi:hypothetical protein